MIPTAVLMKLATLGLSEAQAEAVAGMLSTVEAATKGETKADAEAGIEASREKARARWHKWKASHPETNVSKRLQPLANDSKRLVRADDAPDLENKQTNKQENKEERKQEPAAPAGFPDFWALFPNKVGKRDAEAAFVKALHRADLSTILAGLRRYAAKTDDRPWCNPTTFLNQDRWADEPAVAPPRRQSGQGPPNGRRMNAVEAHLSLEAERQNGQSSRTIDHRDDELFPPDKPGLPRPVVDLSQSFEWPVRQRDH